MESIVSIETHHSNDGMFFESNGTAAILNGALAQATAIIPFGPRRRQICVTEVAARDT
jgi:hypothetical protein